MFVSVSVYCVCLQQQLQLIQNYSDVVVAALANRCKLATSGGGKGEGAVTRSTVMKCDIMK